MNHHVIMPILLCVLLVQCGQRKSVEAVPSSNLPKEPVPVKQSAPVENFPCAQGSMAGAWYEHGMDEAPPAIAGLKDDFLILVDRRLKARNFVSFGESYLRERSVTMDTSNLTWDEAWKTLTLKEKVKKIKRMKRESRIQADSAHWLNNQGQQQVWIINNSADTLSIQMQDWSFICILQALTKGGEWYPIEYWRFSTCGNSYYLKSFPPKTANSFITELPDAGDYLTKLRYKLLGEGRYYYSNVFEGRIDYCKFVVDSTRDHNRYSRRNRYFKLDSLVNLVY